MKFFRSSGKSNGDGRGPAPFAVTPEWAARQREAMVEEQLRRRGIRDTRVLEAMGAVPRHEFVPPESAADAYADRPLPIGREQTISQPYIVAVMTEALELAGTERVLEVGAGSGYQAAVLARLAQLVYTIESDPELFRSAKERLERLGWSDRVVVIEGDGSLGYPEAAPYDAIVVAAAAPSVPDCLFEQLAEGGRLAIPVGSREDQELLQIRKVEGKAVSHRFGLCRFVPLKGSHGWKSE